MQNRRNVLGKIASVVGISTISSITAENASAATSDDGVLYDGKYGKIIRIGEFSYRLTGAESMDEYEKLREKRDELLYESPEEPEPTIQSHSNSAYDSSQGTIKGQDYDIQSDYWAEANNGYLKVKGSCDANWWGGTDYDGSQAIDCEITVGWIAQATFNGNSISLSIPPAATWTTTNNKEEARYERTYDSGVHHPSVTVEKDSVVWEADCFHGTSQDNYAEFRFEDGTTVIDGTYIEFGGLGHCVI